MCQQCGAGFKLPPRRSDAVKFCSRACKTESGYARFNCAACGIEFKRKKSEHVESAARYCSRKCYDTVGKRVNLRVAKLDAPRYYATCEECSGVFRVTATRKNTARFCSRKCQGSNIVFRAECSERQQKEKSWRWTGGAYKNKWGYVRVKANVLGVQAIVLAHRKVIRDALVAEAPTHPFLEMVEDELQLRREIEVHHIDRNRSNNDRHNLLAVTKEAHARIHYPGQKPRPYECWPSDPANW